MFWLDHRSGTDVVSSYLLSIFFVFAVIMVVIAAAFMVVVSVAAMQVFWNRISIVEVHQGRMNVANTSQILGSRTVVQFLKHHVRSRIGVSLRNIAFRVV